MPKPGNVRDLLLDSGGGTPDLGRRAIIALSPVGMGSMTATSLLQTGIVKHLPDPPLPGFASDNVKRVLNKSSAILQRPADRR